MASQRIFQLGLRRAAAPGMSVRSVAQRRLAATHSTSHNEAASLLAKQRTLRPVSPHLSIYKPQITWYGSALNRVTAITLSGSLYLFGFAYLAAPYTGWHLETASMVAAVAAWPLAVKMGVKAFFAFPFFYHVLNGFRHLLWDVGVGFKNTTVARTGWGVVGATVVGALYYTFLV
ncbi:succinate dehydrogenase cytochrome-like protein b560 subunit [Plenodomus tracheiphilus IPT5]|uniref:Succinate dehydrogenase cytochrome-like protein b560 subunit n=1 Tax=Plenodomus tracheiphilus IPT5 TaxID=1408161 RepID=A0A6A7BAV0_9PLEO|nr:succinate dehydrogenase cytochrome-like protein b560 subunit [Plenodomus tracheiphilus IPT5]